MIHLAPSPLARTTPSQRTVCVAAFALVGTSTPVEEETTSGHGRQLWHRHRPHWHHPHNPHWHHPHNPHRHVPVSSAVQRAANQVSGAARAAYDFANDMYRQCTGFRCAAQICCLPMSCEKNGLKVTFADICDDGSRNDWMKVKAAGQIEFSYSPWAPSAELTKYGSQVHTNVGWFQPQVSAQVELKGWGSVTVRAQILSTGNRPPARPQSPPRS
jgi:hypothetical protein